MATEVAAAGAGAISAAGAAIQGFVLSNPVSLAGVAGLVIGVLGYHFLFDHGEKLVDDEHKDDEKDANAGEPATA